MSTSNTLNALHADTDALRVAKIRASDLAVGAAQARTSAYNKNPAPPRMLTGKPLHNNLLVRKIEFVDTGLIATPLTAIRDTGEAEVRAIGPDVSEVAVGDHVLLRKYAGSGTEISHDGQTYLLVGVDELLMVL